LSDLGTGHTIAERFGISFGHNELGRGLLQYCHATSPIFNDCYYGPDLAVYRCPIAVGRDQYAIGRLGLGTDKSINLDDWYAHQLLNIPKCWDCNIGGYCRGGCFVSFLTDSDRFCYEEKQGFDYLINEIVVPKLRHLLKEKR
jgi:radical SAM protein with 4Fe4S-binding SPASM domain